MVRWAGFCARELVRANKRLIEAIHRPPKTRAYWLAACIKTGPSTIQNADVSVAVMMIVRSRSVNAMPEQIALQSQAVTPHKGKGRSTAWPGPLMILHLIAIGGMSFFKQVRGRV